MKKAVSKNMLLSDLSIAYLLILVFPAVQLPDPLPRSVLPGLLLSAYRRDVVD